MVEMIPRHVVLMGEELVRLRKVNQELQDAMIQAGIDIMGHLYPNGRPEDVNLRKTMDSLYIALRKAEGSKP